MRTMSYSESRANYAETLDRVVDDREEVVITRAGHEPVVMVSLADYESLKETAYLVRSPANAKRCPRRHRAARGRRRHHSRHRRRVKLVWDEGAWDDYLWWQGQDRKVLKRINTLLQDVQRHGNEGIGKPEPLKHGFQGYWSRRITDEHRLVYKVVDDEVRIAACRYHYGR